MADHLRNNHVPFRRDCPACVAGSGRNRPHRRRDNPEVGVLSVDLAGPIKGAADGSRYFLLGGYVAEAAEQPGAAVPEEQPPPDPVLAAMLWTWIRHDQDAKT